MTGKRVIQVIALASVVLGLGSEPRLATAGPPVPVLVLCGGGAATAPVSDYYVVELVNTRRVAGARQATGWATPTFAYSPFGLSLAPDAMYVHDLTVQLQDVRPPRSGAYVAWVTTTTLDRVRMLGAFGDDMRVQGSVPWNKYLVVISRETEVDPEAARWSGPVVMRGMSRSGRMHTMAGHGPFQAEPCNKYGY